MANYKKREHYYVKYPGMKPIEVSEEVYRAWAYGVNKERSALKSYYSRAVVDSEGNYIAIPSRNVSLDNTEVALIDVLADCTYEPQQVFERKAQLQLLLSALADMPPEYKLIIDGIFFNQMTEAALADVLGVSQPAISGKKHRAIAWLRKYFAIKGITALDFDLWL